MLFDAGHAPPAVVHQPQAIVERHASVTVPDFVTKVPPGHFAGVSAPCRTLAEARRSAVDDVVRQILGSIGVSYDHRHVNRMVGDVRAVRREIDDDLRGISHGLVLGVEQGIVESTWSRDHGMFTYYVLVKYPDSQIAEMRRLSRGAHVVASVAGEFVHLRESNGVSVVLTSADVIVRKRNRFAPFISFCIWKAPEGSDERFSLAFEAVRLCGSSGRIRLDFGRFSRQAMDYLLGADVSVSVVIRGFDEVGRKVEVKATL